MNERRRCDRWPQAPNGYGVHFPTGEERLVDVFGGMAVAADVEVPEGLVLREAPHGHYGIFECTMQTIGQTWGAIYGEWVPASEYDVDHRLPCFEQFAAGCHESTDPVRIFVAVRKRA